jgi:hypothetical protein
MAERHPELGILEEDEPKVGCETCRWEFMVTPVCAGCAGHWAHFSFEPEKERLYGTTDALDARSLPYGQWREFYRADLAQSSFPAERELVDGRLAFPEYHGEKGQFGYGSPSVVGTVVGAAHGALERGGYRPIRVERYGRARFSVFVVEAREGAQTPDGGTEFRDFGDGLVQANGNRACELIEESSGRRYQFDRYVNVKLSLRIPHLYKPMANVYVFADGSFWPWIPP